MGATAKGYPPIADAPRHLRPSSVITMDAARLKNKTFDEMQVGDEASLVHVLERDDIACSRAVSGDENPTHLDVTYAATDMFGHIVAHGMWTGALISAVLGTKLPGPGTVYLQQDLKFLKPVTPGDTITATVIVREKAAGQARRSSRDRLHQSARRSGAVGESRP